MKVFAENRKARNSYEFLEFFEAGVVLTGPETKSARNGGISIIDAFATIEEEEALIREMNIEPYKYADLIDYDPKTPRKLLLHKKEIEKIERLKGEKGLTCVLTKIYWKDNLIKCDIAMGKGKKHRDQREDIKKRDWERDQGRILKNSRKFS